MDDMPKRNGHGIELLADPTRRRIIALLAIRARQPSILAQELGLSRPATSRQLRLLEDAGLIRSFRTVADGRLVLYGLERRQHGQITAGSPEPRSGVRQQPESRHVRTILPLSRNDRGFVATDEGAPRDEGAPGGQV